MPHLHDEPSEKRTALQRHIVSDCQVWNFAQFHKTLPKFQESNVCETRYLKGRAQNSVYVSPHSKDERE